jgi:hypothetical protein
VTTYHVRAKRWAQGWELHVRDVGVTQVRSLARADRQVRDYLESLLGIDASAVSVEIDPDLGGLEKLLGPTRRKTRDAEEAQRLAAEATRELVGKLRSYGLSVDETASVMGFSAGRVSQIAKTAQPSAPRPKEDRASRPKEASRNDPSTSRTRKSVAGSGTKGQSPSSKAG